VVLLVAAELILRAVAANVAAAELTDAFHLSREPDVSIGGFPFVVQALTGHLSSVTVKDHDFRASGGVSIHEMELTLHGVRFSSGQLLRRRTGTITADRADGNAMLTGPNITAALQARGTNVNVRFAGGKVLLTSPSFPGTLTAKVTLDGRTLTIRPEGTVVTQTLSIVLPEIVNGLDYSRARVVGSVAVVDVRADHPTFRVG